MNDDLKSFFLNPQTPKQRQYEALRMYIIDGVSAREAAQQFGFTENSLYALAHDLRTAKLDFFPAQTTGPKDRRVTPYLRQQICGWRKQDLSVEDIVARLKAENIDFSLSTVERILKDAGFGKLPRRTSSQRGLTKAKTALPKAASNLDFSLLEPFHEECQVAGIFTFLPYIIESGILDVLDALPLPASSVIGKKQAFLSFLALKLMGGERLSHIRQYDHDTGFGIFSGLTVLPKPTYMGTYSCLLAADTCQQLQTVLISQMKAWEPDFFSSRTINLDFHSIPHFGEQSEMEKVWCGARNKAMKGANTFFAQDAESNVILYANADILHKDSSEEILHFVEHLKAVKGVINETLVFDSRLTSYSILGKLDDANIKFITLRRRGKKLLTQTDAIPEKAWQTVKLPIPKRKYPTFLAYESEIQLQGCPQPLRQIIMKDHGRAEPTFVITNNRDMKLIEILMVYAHRWRIENKLAELVHFFNLNSLSSPIMVRIFFDLLLSVVASFLYHRLEQDFPRFEKKRASYIFRQFIDMPGKIRYDGEQFEIRIRKHSHTPLLLGLKKIQEPFTVPWLDGKQMKIIYTT